MIDLGEKSHCICQRYNSLAQECINEYTISEQGKSIRLMPKNSSEKVMAIVIDKCVINDNDTKCDAMFLYATQNSTKYTFLVELKGAGDIPKAFEQLAYTRNNRQEYKDIRAKFEATNGTKAKERFAIVSNGILPKPKLEQLENSFKIRVKTILHCEATTPIPDLKSVI